MSYKIKDNWTFGDLRTAGVIVEEDVVDIKSNYDEIRRIGTGLGLLLRFHPECEIVIRKIK